MEGVKGLTEKQRKQLLLNALGDDEYQCLLNRLSTTKPYEAIRFEFPRPCQTSKKTVPSHFSNAVLKRLNLEHRRLWQ